MAAGRRRLEEEGEGQEDEDGGHVGTAQENDGRQGWGGGGAALAKTFAAGRDGGGLLGGKMRLGVVRKREREEEERREQRRKRERRREEARDGKVIPLMMGADPEADRRERRLQVLATRGVVHLLNAITKAQRGGGEGKSKTATDRKSFIQELRKISATENERDDKLVAGRATRDVGGEDDDFAKGWGVLQEGYYQGKKSNKLKDWDREDVEEEFEIEEEFDDAIMDSDNQSD